MGEAVARRSCYLGDRCHRCTATSCAHHRWKDPIDVTAAIVPDPHGLSDLLGVWATCLGDAPVLPWQLDVRKNELTCLTGEPCGRGGDEVALILKNPAHARAMVLPEDQGRFFACVERIRALHPAATVVRVRESDGPGRWIAIVAMPDPGRAMWCVGLLADCSGLVDIVLGASSASRLDDMIAAIDDPVILMSARSRRPVAANPAARALLGAALDRPGGLSLDDLLRTSSGAGAAELFEALVFRGRWSGLLAVPSADGEARLCTARIRALPDRTENLLWVALVPETTEAGDPSAAASRKGTLGEPPAAAVAALATAEDIPAMLRAILAHQPPGMAADAVMRSRIFIAENRVVVTGVARSSQAMPTAEAFPYEGSIAENIVRFGLDHLIVEDTSRSIKPIDWVLFIPKGIRSYFALPFFVGGVLHNVLIVCSTEVGRFGEADVRAFAPLLGPIEAALDRLEETRAAP